MAKVTVESSGKSDARLRLLEFAARRGLMLAAERIKLRAVQLMHAEAPDTIATGQTERSIAVRPATFGTDAGGRYIEVKIGPRTIYARWGVEYGTRAGYYPPYRKIYDWLREKPFGKGIPEREMYPLVKAIQKTIYEKGVQGKYILHRAVDLEREAAYIVVKNSVMAVLRGGM